MKKILLIIYTTVILASLTAPAIAQKKNIVHQQMIWYGYNGKYNLSPYWNINLEVEDRRFAFPDRQQYWVLPRIGLYRKLSSGWAVGAGFTYYLNNSPGDPNKGTAITIPELRPHEELDYKQQVGKLEISHRYKLEERFQHHNDGKQLTPGYIFNFRARYRLQLQYPLTKSGNLSAKASDEILLNFGHAIVANTFDQNRIYAGLNYKVSEKVQLELGYLNWFQEQSDGQTYLDRDVLRFTFFHNINFY